MKYLLALMAAAAISGGSATSHARDDEGERAEEPSPELRWSLGAGFIVAPRPYAGADAEAFPVPILSLEYDRWFVQGIRGGYTWLRTERWSANVFAQPQFRGFDAASSPFLEGMESRRMSMDGGLELIYRGRPVGFRFAALSDVLGRNEGQEVSLLGITGAPLGDGRLVLVGFGPRWVSANRVDYYYGVRPAEAAPGRPAYEGSGTVSWDLNVTLLVDIGSRWSLFTLVNREGFGSAIRSSPLIDRDATYGLVAALSYEF